MTSPDHGNDYVAARVQIEIPDGADQKLREIIQATERLQVAMESATRAGGDMNNYLERIAEASRRASEEQNRLTQSMQVQNSMGHLTNMSVPLGGAQSPPQPHEVGMGYGRNPTGLSTSSDDLRARNPGAWMNMMAANGEVGKSDAQAVRVDNLQDVANKIAQRQQELVEQDRLTHIADDGEGEGTPFNHNRARSFASKGADISQRLMNQVGPGASWSTLGEMALKGVNYAQQRMSQQAAGRPNAPGSPGAGMGGSPPGSGPPPQTPTGGADEPESGGGGASALKAAMGAIATKLPVVGTAIAAITAGAKVFEKVGQVGREARDLGSIRGGAGGEGLQAMARAKMMTLNPFISQDQARQIYQSVMSEGYADASGGGADNVIDFVSNNIQHMSISVADSMKMLRATIIGGGDGSEKGVNHALTLLNDELDKIRNISRGTVMSQPEFRSGVMSMQQNMMDAGVSPEAAAASAMIAEQVGGQSQSLKGQFGSIVGDMSTQGGGAWLRTFGGPGGTALQGTGGLFPQAIPEWLSKQGPNAIPDAVENMLQRDVQMAARNPIPENQEVMFQRFLKSQTNNDSSIAANTSLSAARELMEEIRSGKQSDELKRVEEAAAGGVSGGGGRGGSNEVNGSVTIDLTPRAAQLLQVDGGRKVGLTRVQRGANQGRSNMSVNNDQGD